MATVETLAGVSLNQLDPKLRAALDLMGELHQLLFKRALTVTSTNDGKHVKGSKHYSNLAFDMRSWDKTEAEQAVWSTLLGLLATKHNLAVFDERARDKGPHWHVEVAD